MKREAQLRQLMRRIVMASRPPSQLALKSPRSASRTSSRRTRTNHATGSPNEALGARPNFPIPQCRGHEACRCKLEEWRAEDHSPEGQGTVVPENYNQLDSNKSSLAIQIHWGQERAKRVSDDDVVAIGLLIMIFHG